MALHKIRQVVVGIDVIVSFVILGIFYASTSAVTLPGYLLIVLYDGLSNAYFPAINQTWYDIGQLLFIYVLAVGAGALARGFRRRFGVGDSGQTPLSDVTVPLAAILALFGVLVLLISVPPLISTVVPIGIGLGGLLLLCSAGLLRYTAHYTSDRHTESTETA